MNDEIKSLEHSLDSMMDGLNQMRDVMQTRDLLVKIARYAQERANRENRAYAFIEIGDDYFIISKRELDDFLGAMA